MGKLSIGILAGLAFVFQSHAQPLSELTDWLAKPRNSRAPIESLASATTALSKAEAKAATDLLWADRSQWIKQSWTTEWNAKTLTDSAGKIMPFDYRIYGQQPATSRDLYISMHGGGNAAASVNDQQWENQIILYQPPGIYLAPRAPTNTWNLWHEAHIDGFFDKIIQSAVVFLGANPNRVYVMGYSAGGDGTYQIAPRMADRWAAAAMMAGHPNDASPLSLRNIGFAIHVGALDSAYQRNSLGALWGRRLDTLQKADSSGYAHQVQIHTGKPHWMDLEDAVALPWMATFTRNPFPRKIVWKQDDEPHRRFYWLGLPDSYKPKATDTVVAEIQGQQIDIQKSNVEMLRFFLHDSLLNLDNPIIVNWKGKKVFEGVVSRTLPTIRESIEYRGDREMNFSGSLTLSATSTPLQKAHTKANPFDFTLAQSATTYSVNFKEPISGIIRVMDLRGRILMWKDLRNLASVVWPQRAAYHGVVLIQVDKLAGGQKQTRIKRFIASH